MQYLQSIVKWPGGKSNEIVLLQQFLPDCVQRYYVEPFFGGGALFFHLCPHNAIINDTCSDLMNLYKFVQQPYSSSERQKFENVLYAYVNQWEHITAWIIHKQNTLLLLRRQSTDRLFQTILYDLQRIVDVDICSDIHLLWKFTRKRIIDKIKRSKKIEQTNSVQFTDQNIIDNIEAAIKSGFYMYWRHVMNCDTLELPHKIANFYFVRELCYGAMFRYNKKGHFNIPYGGMSYNKKNMRTKVDHVVSKPIQKALSQAHITSKDFEYIFKQYDLDNRDFIFLDPPYDTDFNSYGNISFGTKDHKRLAQQLYDTKAKFMMVIKKTKLIDELYQNKFYINAFDKRYLYNVKNRNEQEVDHLVIRNYK